MKTFEITRTRLVTERFRVCAENEDDALELLCDDSSNAEQIEESTHHSNLDRIEEI